MGIRDFSRAAFKMLHGVFKRFSPSGVIVCYFLEREVSK